MVWRDITWQMLPQRKLMTKAEVKKWISSEVDCQLCGARILPTHKYIEDGENYKHLSCYKKEQGE